MGDSNLKERQEDIYSQAIRAGKRTYFFDVKATKANEMYLTITESKRSYSTEEGKFKYEKHKVFLFKEDFEKFSDGFKDVVRFIETGEKTDPQIETTTESEMEDKSLKMHSDISFEDLE